MVTGTELFGMQVNPIDIKFTAEVKSPIKEFAVYKDLTQISGEFSFLCLTDEGKAYVTIANINELDKNNMSFSPAKELNGATHIGALKDRFVFARGDSVGMYSFETLPTFFVHDVTKIHNTPIQKLCVDATNNRILTGSAYPSIKMYSPNENTQDENTQDVALMEVLRDGYLLNCNEGTLIYGRVTPSRTWVGRMWMSFRKQSVTIAVHVKFSFDSLWGAFKRSVFFSDQGMIPKKDRGANFSFSYGLESRSSYTLDFDGIQHYRVPLAAAVSDCAVIFYETATNKNFSIKLYDKDAAKTIEWGEKDLIQKLYLSRSNGIVGYDLLIVCANRVLCIENIDDDKINSDPKVKTLYDVLAEHTIVTSTFYKTADTLGAHPQQLLFLVTKNFIRGTQHLVVINLAQKTKTVSATEVK